MHIVRIVRTQSFGFLVAKVVIVRNRRRIFFVPRLATANKPASKAPAVALCSTVLLHYSPTAAPQLLNRMGKSRKYFKSKTKRMCQKHNQQADELAVWISSALKINFRYSFFFFYDYEGHKNCDTYDVSVPRDFAYSLYSARLQE